MPTIVLYCIVVCCFASHLPEERHTWGWPTFISIVRSRFMTQYAIDTCCAKWISRKSQLLHLTSHAFGLQMKFFLAFCHIVGIGLNLTRTQLKDCIEKLLRDHQHIQNLELSDLVRIGGGANAPERFTNLSLWSAANHFTNNTLCCSSSHFYPFFSAEQSNFIPASAIFWNPLSSRQTQLRCWWECLLWRVRTIWQSDNLRTINNQREHFADHQRCFLPPHHHLRHCRYVARWWVCGQREIIIAWQGRLPILLPIEDLKIDILMQRELNEKLYFHSDPWKICSN